MSAILIALLLAPVQETDKEVDAAIAVFQKYVQALKDRDFDKAGSFMHPKSLVKFRANFSDRLDEPQRDPFAKVLGYADWKEMAEDSDKGVFAHFMMNMGKFLGKETTKAVLDSRYDVVGGLKKDGLVYIVINLTVEVGEKKTVSPSVQTLYRDGENWRLAHRNETNIGEK